MPPAVQPPPGVPPLPAGAALPGAAPPPAQPAGWGAPPLPPGYVPQDPGPPKKRRVGLLIGLIGGGVTTVLAALVILVVVVTQPDSHSLGTPNSAAGLSRDSSAEQRVNTNEIKRHLRDQTNGEVKKVVSAVYSSSPGSAQPMEVLFIGGEASSVPADSIISDFESGAQDVRRVDNPAGLDGKGVCGEVSGTTGSAGVACVWADNDTFGQLYMLNDGPAVGDLADIMKRIRPELEKKS